MNCQVYLGPLHSLVFQPYVSICKDMYVQSCSFTVEIEAYVDCTLN